MSALSGCARHTSHPDCFVLYGTARRLSGTQNGRGHSAVQKQSLTLAEFEAPFSRCADGNLVTALKLSCYTRCSSCHFAAALCQVLDHKGLTKKKIDTTELAIGIIDRFNVSAPYSLLVFCSCSPYGKRRKFSYGPLASLLCGIHTQNVTITATKVGTP